MLAAIEGSFLDCRNCEVAVGSCADVLLRVLQPRRWDSEVPRTSSCREKVVCYCTRSEPASLKALLNFLLLQSWHLASFPANRGALLIGERLEVFEICLCGNDKTPKHLLGSRHWVSRVLFDPCYIWGGREMLRFRVLVLFSTFLFSPGLSFKPFHNIAAGPGEMISCKREEQQKANQTPKSAKQSLYEAVKGKFVCAGWVKEDTGCSSCVAYDTKIPFFQTLLQEDQMQVPECLYSQLILKCWTIINHDMPCKETLI